ncbi:MAG: hypothetical protein AAF901_12180, partial [Bacteroidota bacterium]
YRMTGSAIGKKLRNEPLYNVLNSSHNYGFSNLQARWISGIGNNKVSDDTLLSMACENLEKRFLVFGLVERFDESLLNIAHHLQWKYPPFYSTLNSSTFKEKTKLEFNENTLKLIEELNQVDLKFYEFAFKRFEEYYQIDNDYLNSFRLRLKYFQYLHRGYLKIKGLVR